MDATMESVAAEVQNEDKTTVPNLFALERKQLIKLFRARAHVIYIKCNENYLANQAIRQALLNCKIRMEHKLKNSAFHAYEYTSVSGMSEMALQTFSSREFSSSRWLDVDDEQTIQSQMLFPRPKFEKESLDVSVLKEIEKNCANPMTKTGMVSNFFVIPDLNYIQSNCEALDLIRRFEGHEDASRNSFVTFIILGSKDFIDLPSEFRHTCYKLDWNRPKTNEEVKNFIYSLMAEPRVEDIDEICKVLSHKEYKTIENILCYAMVEYKLNSDNGKFTSGHIIKLIETGMF